MNIGWNIETFVHIASIVLSIVGAAWIIRVHWKSYGTLYLLSLVAGQVFCAIFVWLDFYSFPYQLFRVFSGWPVTAVITVFPFYVLLGVRYSPASWAWKIPFYWVMVHLGMTAEVWAENRTDLIRYDQYWDVWDSYTWWWIYLLLFEWIGGLLVPPKYRKPLNVDWLRYGKLGWFILHFVLIGTIFLAGIYVGRVTMR